MAIRAAKSAKQNSMCKSIKVGAHIAVSPDSGRSASRAVVRLDPVKITTLFKNFIEFFLRKREVSFYPLCGVVKTTRCLWGDGRPIVTPFLNKKSLFPEAHLIG